ncbi:hypothetical protein C8R43DRAFT_641106 [Mycena crocata]|nr:hypothetical protein C8R43DRAFT_641106 [Mycena crocata]
MSTQTKPTMRIKLLQRRFRKVEINRGVILDEHPMAGLDHLLNSLRFFGVFNLVTRLISELRSYSNSEISQHLMEPRPSENILGGTILRTRLNHKGLLNRFLNKFTTSIKFTLDTCVAQNAHQCSKEVSVRRGHARMPRRLGAVSASSFVQLLPRLVPLASQTELACKIVIPVTNNLKVDCVCYWSVTMNLDHVRRNNQEIPSPNFTRPQRRFEYYSTGHRKSFDAVTFGIIMWTRMHACVTRRS